MKSVLEVFWELVLGITGAVALSALAVAGGAFALGCLAFGCACSLRSVRRRMKARAEAKD